MTIVKSPYKEVGQLSPTQGKRAGKKYFDESLKGMYRIKRIKGRKKGRKKIIRKCGVKYE